MNTVTAVALPSVAELSREQRSALLVALIKAHFEDLGMPFPLVIRDGETVLGVFHPKATRPPKTRVPDE